MFRTKHALSTIHENNSIISIKINKVKINKVQPFDSFSAAYKILFWTGYYKPSEQSTRSYARIFYQIYRVFSFLIVVNFTFMHIVFTWQHRKDMDDLLENIIIAIPQINLLTKILTFNFQSKRINKINKLLHDPIFAANCEKDEEYFTKDKIEMHGLSRLLNIGVSLTGLLWPISFFVKRLKNQKTVIPAYVPFETTTWFGFFWSVVLEVGPVLWVGYGHMNLDCVAVTYYSQIRVQLKIMKHNLERLFETQIITENDCRYKDVLDKNLHNSFVGYVKRYEQLIWYSKEVNSLFNFSITVQFVTSSTIICAVIYKMSTEDVLSASFMFNLAMFILLLAQVFLYCYYGNLVNHESQSINRSVFMSDWSAMSPSFRKQLLIAMTRWSIPIIPKVCGVIPILLPTFIKIVRLSHTLYTILLTKHK